MKTEIELKNFSEGQVLDLGRGLGQILRNQKAVLELVGDVGAGKTTFTRGLLEGLGGDSSEVSSPTFTLENVYSAPQNSVHHFDFYRLSEVGLLAEQLSEAIDQPNSIVVVEWAERLPDGLLGQSKISIQFQRIAEGENLRDLEITTENQGSRVQESLNKLQKGLAK